MPAAATAINDIAPIPAKIGTTTRVTMRFIMWQRYRIGEEFQLIQHLNLIGFA
jgi:hypothetical protein